MFEFIGDLFTFAFDLVKMSFAFAGDLLEFAFGLLGGLFSLILSLGGVLLAGALILVAVIRRRNYKKRCHPYGEDGASATYDVDKEEFTSFYDQYRTEE